MSTGLDRVVAGLSCRAVLERLSPLLDGELAAPDRAAVERHLAGCENCARFGGEVGALVGRLRGGLDGERVEGVERVRGRVMAALGAMGHSS